MGCRTSFRQARTTIQSTRATTLLCPSQQLQVISWLSSLLFMFERRRDLESAITPTAIAQQLFPKGGSCYATIPPSHLDATGSSILPKNLEETCYRTQLHRSRDQEGGRYMGIMGDQRERMAEVGHQIRQPGSSENTLRRMGSEELSAINSRYPSR